MSHLRRNRGTVAGFIAGVALAGLLASLPAWALGCNNCVDTTDVKDNQIRTEDIRNGHVLSADIGNGTITATDLGASAKAAAGSATLFGTTTSATATDIDSFDVVVPATGVLMVRVDGGVWLERDSASTSSVIATAEIGLCTSPDTMSFLHCGTSTVEINSSDPDNAGTENQTQSFSLSKTLGMPAGTQTFYLNVKVDTASTTFNLYGGANGNNATATAAFFPGSLSVTSDAPL